MSEINTGGPAFPCPNGCHANVNSAGMSLRDYFAAKVMAKLIEVHGDVNRIVDNDGWVSLHLRAYEHADAMLAEREK